MMVATKELEMTVRADQVAKPRLVRKAIVTVVRLANLANLQI
jgi:hypothetical protein